MFFRDLHCEYWSEQEPWWHPETATRIPIIHGQTWKAKVNFEGQGTAHQFYVGCHMDMGGGRWNTTEKYFVLPYTANWTRFTYELPLGVYNRFDLGDCRLINCEKYILHADFVKAIGDWDRDTYHNRVVGHSEFRNLIGVYSSQRDRTSRPPGSSVPIAHGEWFDGAVYFDHRGQAETVIIALAMKMPGGNWNTAAGQMTVPASYDWKSHGKYVLGNYDYFGLAACSLIDVDKYIARLDGTTILRDGDTECYHNVLGPPEFNVKEPESSYW